VRQKRARHRLRDWIILLLRAGAVALLAWAFARPLIGAKPLIANSTSIGAANEFRYQHNGDGAVSFEAPTTGYYVHAPDDGTTPMSAGYNFEAFGYLSYQELFFYEPVRVG